jgi:hypothetical protein
LLVLGFVLLRPTVVGVRVVLRLVLLLFGVRASEGLRILRVIELLRPE